jgi:hypothetical protein
VVLAPELFGALKNQELLDFGFKACGMTTGWQQAASGAEARL